MSDLSLIVTRHWLRPAVAAYLAGRSSPPDMIALENLGATPDEAGQIVAEWSAPPAVPPLTPTSAKVALAALASAIAAANGDPGPLTASGWSAPTATEIVTAINLARP